MKIAIISDIHGNLAALETVTEHLEKWAPDKVWVGGDIVNRGPMSAECVQFVQEKQLSDGWMSVRGNHEDYVILQDLPDSPRSGPLFDIFRPATWVYERMGRNISWIQSLPDYHFWHEHEKTEACLTHGWVGRTHWGIFRFMKDDTIRRAIGFAPPPLFLTAHTHHPFRQRIDDTYVVNVGSVGLPFDGDWRATYVQATYDDGKWEVEVIRLSYDRKRTIEEFESTGYMDYGGPVTQLMLNELLEARPQMFSFTRDYQKDIVDGLISIEIAVGDHLRSQGFEYPVVPAHYL